MKLSAVITTYDRPKLLRRAVRSVFVQTYSPDQILVVEDGTDSGIETWLEEEGHDTVQYVRHHKNMGLAAARNTGLKEASGDYIAYLDDDDQWKRDRLEKQVALLRKLSQNEQERTGVIYALHETKYPDGTVVSSEGDCNEGRLREAIVRQEKLTTPPSSFLFSKAALRNVGGFDEQLPSSIDHDIWMALADAGYYGYYVDEPLVINSKEGHGTMVTNTAPRIQGVLQFSKKWRPVFRKWLGDNRGDEFMERYVSQVIGKLSGEKAKNGQWREALRVAIESFRHTQLSTYNMKVQADKMSRGIMRRYVSRGLRKKIKKIVAN